MSQKGSRGGYAWEHFRISSLTELVIDKSHCSFVALPAVLMPKPSTLKRNLSLSRGVCSKSDKRKTFMKDTFHKAEHQASSTHSRFVVHLPENPKPRRKTLTPGSRSNLTTFLGLLVCGLLWETYLHIYVLVLNGEERNIIPI